MAPDPGAAGFAGGAGVVAISPEGLIVTEGVSVWRRFAFCRLPMVPRFCRVSFAFAARTTFWADVRGWLFFCGLKPNFVRS